MRLVNIIAVCAFAAAAGCASAPDGKAEAITGKDWFLREVRLPDRVITLDRARLESEGMGDVFSLRFDGPDRVSGKGAPNRYTASCELRDNAALTIGTAAATRMFSFKEPEQLKEGEFFDYLSRVAGWRLAPGGRLELLLAPDKDGRQTVLAFAAKK